MLRTLIGVLAASVFWISPSNAYPDQGHAAPWDQASRWPDRIIATPGEDPSTSFSVTWRTDASVDEAVIEWIEANADAAFNHGSMIDNARVERVDLEAVRTPYGQDFAPNHGRGVVHSFSNTFTDLSPGTTYAYRVRGARGHWSEWFHTRTAPAEGQLDFLYFGDAQRGVHSHWSRMIRQGVLTAPDADFILHAGDLINRGHRDTEWAEWFDAGDFIHAMFPTIPVAGNHEHISTGPEGSRGGQSELTELWRPHFTLPVEEQLPESLHEATYDIRYPSGLHVFVLDSSHVDWQVQMDWLVETSRASDATWKIVALHHSPFRPGIAGRAYHERRQQVFLRAARRAGIDMVLAGHNHSYSRSSYGRDVGPGLQDNGARLVLGDPSEVEMAVVISASGGMSGRLDAERFARGNANFGDDLALQRWGHNTPTYQHIKIDGLELRYTAYTALGEAYDAFTLEQIDGRLMLTNGEAAFGDPRSYDNTGARVDHDWLR